MYGIISKSTVYFNINQSLLKNIGFHYKVTVIPISIQLRCCAINLNIKMFQNKVIRMITGVLWNVNNKIIYKEFKIN